MPLFKVKGTQGCDFSYCPQAHSAASKISGSGNGAEFPPSHQHTFPLCVQSHNTLTGFATTIIFLAMGFPHQETGTRTRLQSSPVPWAQPQNPTWFRFPISPLPKDYKKCVFKLKIWLTSLPETQTSKPSQTIPVLIMAHFFTEGNEGCKQAHVWGCGRSQTSILRAGNANPAHNHAGIYFLVCF